MIKYFKNASAVDDILMIDAKLFIMCLVEVAQFPFGRKRSSYALI